MGITVFKDSSDSSRTYLRVTRAINGKEQQRYVRVAGKSKTAMQKAMAEAKEIDLRLQQWQKAVRHLMAMQGESLIHDDGTIVGLQLQRREREGRKPATEFKIRVKLADKPPYFKSVSVDKYGFENAFRMSVERICELRDLAKDTEAHEKMLKCIDAYKEKLSDDHETEQHESSEGWIGQTLSRIFKR
jgi:hypothetical protein